MGITSDNKGTLSAGWLSVYRTFVLMSDFKLNLLQCKCQLSYCIQKSLLENAAVGCYTEQT